MGTPAEGLGRLGGRVGGRFGRRALAGRFRGGRSGAGWTRPEWPQTGRPLRARRDSSSASAAFTSSLVRAAVSRAAAQAHRDIVEVGAARLLHEFRRLCLGRSGAHAGKASRTGFWSPGSRRPEGAWPGAVSNGGLVQGGHPQDPEFRGGI